MNKRFLSVVILGVLFSPPVMASEGQHVVLYEKAHSDQGLRPENEIVTGQNPLSLTAGESAECSALVNPRRELLARAEAQGARRGRVDSGRAL